MEKLLKNGEKVTLAGFFWNYTHSDEIAPKTMVTVVPSELRFLKDFSKSCGLSVSKIVERYIAAYLLDSATSQSKESLLRRFNQSWRGTILNVMKPAYEPSEWVGFAVQVNSYRELVIGGGKASLLLSLPSEFTREIKAIAYDNEKSTSALVGAIISTASSEIGQVGTVLRGHTITI